MKNIKNKFLVCLLIILTHLSFYSVAQNPNYPVTYNEDYRQKINHVFANMPLHQVPSGLLADYSVSKL